MSEGKKNIVSPPKKIENYEFESVIGKGSYGVVFCYKNIETEEKIAVKLSKIKESQFLANYDNKGLVKKLFAYSNKVENVYLLAMPLADCDLFQYILERPALSKEEVIQIMFELSSGLKTLHEKGICHMDLKINNVLWFREDNSFRIADFGLSCRKGDKIEIEYKNGLPETRSWLASEKIDVWCLGRLFFEISTKRPFDKELLQDQEFMRVHIGEKYTPLILQMLDEDPEKRPTAKKIYFKFKV